MLLWQRAREPGRRRLGAPRRLPRRRRDARGSIRRHSQRRSTCASSRIWSSSAPGATPTATPASASSRPPTSASSPPTPTRRSRPTRHGTRSTGCRRWRSTTGDRARRRERLRAKLSYTNLGFALAPPTFTIPELRELYAAALGYEVSATNLQRVLLRRELLEDDGRAPAARAAGGRPGDRFPLPLARARGHGPVRGAAAPYAVRVNVELQDRLQILRRAGTTARGDYGRAGRVAAAHCPDEMARRRGGAPRGVRAFGCRAAAAAAAVALAVRPDRPARRAVDVLRPHAARGHRRVREPRRRAPRIDRRARKSGTALESMCHAADARGRPPLRRRAPRDARRAHGLHPALERPHLLRRLRHGSRDVSRAADHHHRRPLGARGSA